MAIQPIRFFGDPVLRLSAQPVTVFDKELRTLVRDLTETMKDAPGAGLAAPQIGVSLRVFTYHVEGVTGHLINPVLDLTEDEQDGPEGCLSLPGLTFDCRRAFGVVAKGFNEYGDPVTIEGTEGGGVVWSAGSKLLAASPPAGGGGAGGGGGGGATATRRKVALSSFTGVLNTTSVATIKKRMR